MTDHPPSPKGRLRAVYTVSEGTPRRTEDVVYQLEDTGHPALRMRPSVRILTDGDHRRYLYRVEAFSRVRGTRLGAAEKLAAPGSAAEFAAESRQFQSAPFRHIINLLKAALEEKFPAPDTEAPIQR